MDLILFKSVSANNVMRYLFIFCCILSIAWLAAFSNHPILQTRSKGGIYIEQTLTGEYIISIHGKVDDSNLVEQLLRYTPKQNSGPGSDVIAQTSTTANESSAQASNQSPASKADIDAKNDDTTSMYDVTTGYDDTDSLWESKNSNSDGNITERVVSFRDYKCPTKMIHTDISDIFICGKATDVKRKLIFFTTMYYSDTSLNLFYNTLRVIASMQRDYNVKPVLFLENPNGFLKANQTHFIQFACDLGWTVLLAPQCNKYGFPVFKSMFNVSMETWDADWYGYSNGDMLFDGTLISTIDFIQSHGNILKIPMLVGRRYNLAIGLNTKLTHYRQIKKLHFTSHLDTASAVDYFLARKNIFPWHEIPDFVVGRPVYDTWMVWFAQHAMLPVVETTATVRAIHQNQKGLSYIQNTHRSRRVKDGMNYNKNLAQEIRKKNKKMNLQLSLGYLSCLPLKLIKMEAGILNYMVSHKRTTIVGRGKDHYPIEADDKEYLEAIQFFSQSHAQNNGSEVEKNASAHAKDVGQSNTTNLQEYSVGLKVYEMNSSATAGRHLLAKKVVRKVKVKRSSQNKNTKPEEKKQQSSDNAHKNQSIQKSNVKSNASATSAKSISNSTDIIKNGHQNKTISNKDLSRNKSIVSTVLPMITKVPPTMHKAPPTTQKTPPTSKNTLPTLKNSSVISTTLSSKADVSNAKSSTHKDKPVNSYTTLSHNVSSKDLGNKNGTASTANNSVSSATKMNDTLVKNTTKSVAKKKMSWGEYIKKLNEKSGYREPAMIPFIGESEDYVFVLVRRTAYLQWKLHKPGFNEVSFSQQCHKKQNIDRELSELVTF